MGKKAAKSTRKFAASGQLKKKIQARHKHQQDKKKFEKRRGNKGRLSHPSAEALESDGDGDEEAEETRTQCVATFMLYYLADSSWSDRLKGMSVDDFLGAGFMEEGSDEVCSPTCYAPRIQCFQEEDLEGTNSGEGQEEDEDELEDDGSLPPVDDLDGM